ncbi:DUF58 domain-containing protein [Rubritalea marina]|uniref:DUF58 domain-containing protein n=1 Tax=Rubritalea marina TaxID=361055 RepID=UPI0003763E7C|nr:DUF58 domain-containing protein [Rubritalea marina]
MSDPIHVLAMSGLSSFLIGVITYVGPLLCVLVLWRRYSCKPTALSVAVGGGWFLLGVLVSIVPGLELLWWIALALWAGLMVIDLLVLLRMAPLSVERVLPGRFAINQEAEITLKLINASRLPLRLRVYDGLPEVAEAQGLPWLGKVDARAYAEISYNGLFRKRGEWQVDAAHIEHSGALGFWSRQIRAGEVQSTRVYPNYEPVIQFSLLAMENKPEQMGIVMKDRAGMSKEFHQLRDYQLGDTLSSVDWKASSKKLQLISREFQEQRDQTLILAVDCGRRMRAMDGDIPQFDHCLNAMLLLAYVALKQGDKVGILNFGGEDRWLAPVKGIHSMTAILNHLYDYQTTTAPSDYAEAAERLLMRQQRRSMVVFLSNVRGEDGADLIDPLRQVRMKHVTLLANLREAEVMQRLDEEVRGLDDALAVGATQLYLDERAALLKQLEQHGIIALDETAQELPIALSNAYLMMRDAV